MALGSQLETSARLPSGIDASCVSCSIYGNITSLSIVSPSIRLISVIVLKTITRSPQSRCLDNSLVITTSFTAHPISAFSFRLGAIRYSIAHPRTKQGCAIMGIRLLNPESTLPRSLCLRASKQTFITSPTINYLCPVADLILEVFSTCEGTPT